MQKSTYKKGYNIYTSPKLLVLISFFLFSLCEDTITKIKETDWFFANLLKHDDTLGKTFDLVSSYSFLSSADKTGCFSPICAEINFHLQLIHREYGIKYCSPSKTHLKILINKIRKVNKKILKTANCVFMPAGESVSRTTSEPHGYLCEFYGKREEDIYNACEAYEDWISIVTEGEIKSKLPRKALEENSRIYVSSITFRDDWLSKFDPINSSKEYFKLSNDKTVKRMYMKKRSYFQYRKLTNNEFNFEMVVVPFQEENSEGKTSRVMVYLIPENNKIKQADLWNDFYEISKTKGGIKQTISRAERKLIDLNIPKIEKLESKLNTMLLFNNIFEKKKCPDVDVASQMSTFLSIDEDGTKASAVMVSLFKESIRSGVSVWANVPYIAFIYDLDLERILFILNDNGPVENNY